MCGDRIDLFISHAGPDRAWAEWVAWQLEKAGYTVELDVWDWAAGRNFVTAMSDALERCHRVVALFSVSYVDRSRYTTEEWTAAFLHDLGITEGKLVPVRVEAVPAADMPAVLRPLVFGDLFGLDADEARRVLLEAVAGPRHPDGEPVFPGYGARDGLPELGESGPRLPGSVPGIWNVPARNPGFTGRDDLLAKVRERLLDGNKAVVQALHGMGGVGKTQLAAEYAYRFAGTYDLVWWITSEQTGLIGEQIAALAEELGCAGPETGLPVARRAVLRELRRRGRWLLVFDNAENPPEVTPWLPGGNGHVLITSRSHRWAEVAVPVEVDVLARTESMAMLRDRVARLSAEDAYLVADALGDLPLAIAQAADYMADTGMSAGEYAGLLGTRAEQLMEEGRSTSYPRSLAAVTVLALDRLRSEAPAAARLTEVCAFLAAEPVPAIWFTGAAAELPAELAAQAVDPVALRRCLAQVSRSALARVDGDGMQMHRLTQAILRSHLSTEPAAVTCSRAEAVLTANDPGDPNVPNNWLQWARLMPHLLALNPVDTSNAELRRLVCRGVWNLIKRGDARSGRDLAEKLHQHWHGTLGPDHPDTLNAATILAFALFELGNYREARDLDEDTLAQHRRALGDDHIETLRIATHVDLRLRSLGEFQAAREMGEDTLARCRRVLGEDHPLTLGAADNLAGDLFALGDYQAARELNEDTLARRRRVLGEDHPDTLRSAANLAGNLWALGEFQAAREMGEDTLARCRRVLGEDHPLTLDSATNLAGDLFALGEFQAAREMGEDTLARYRRVLGEDHPHTLASAHNLAVDLHVLGDYQTARGLYEETLAQDRRVLGQDHPDTLRAASNLGEDLRALGDYQAAQELDEDTLVRRRRVLDQDHPDTLASANYLAVDLRALGDYQAARDLHQETLARYRRVRGDDHPDTLACANNLAADLHALGELEAAQDLHQETLARYRRVLGEDHPDTLACANNLAADLRELGETQAARDLDADTLARYRRVRGDDHPDTLACASNLAADLHALGELEAARDLHEKTLARYRRVLGEDHPDTLDSASNLGEDLRALGELEAARDLHQETLARYRRVLGEDHPDTLRAASNLGEDLRALGELEAARDLHQETLARYRRVLGKDHPDTLRAASNLGEDLRALGEAVDDP